MLHRNGCVRLIGCLLALVLPALVRGQEAPPALTLHEIIDQHITAPNGVTVATCSDAEFLRRASIDLIGMPPTVDELRSFLADAGPTKRADAVDRLQASPRYARHLAEVCDVLLMERRPCKNVTQDEWMAYLLQSVRANKPWNQLVRELLLADGDDDDAPRAAARFYLDRGSEPNLLARDVGRIFFGRDMQCAQCHDHPIIDDYLQSDYHGLLAFFAPGYEIKLQDGDKEVAYYAERATTDLQFESVFIKGTRHITGARVPGGIELAEPTFLPGEEYTVAPADNVRPIPKYSRRTQLTELATSGANPLFNENIVNRLWAMMLGRGLVQPVDLHHPANPATHPELLKLLAARFAAMNFDVNAFLREVALSQAYQRPFDTPAEILAASEAAAPLVAPLEQQRAAAAAKASESQSAFNSAIEAWNGAEAAFLPAALELDALRTKYADIVKRVGEAEKAVADAQAPLAAKQAAATAIGEASTKAQTAVAALPGDQEVAAAAQTFATRLEQLTAEVGALQATLDEKAAAVAAPQAEREAARPPVEAAQQTADALHAAVREQEQIVVSLRQQARADTVALHELDARLEETRLLASVKTLEGTAVAAWQAIEPRQAELTTARAEMSEVAASMAQHEAGVQAAQSAEATAREAVEEVRKKHAAQSDTAQTVVAALTAAEAALAKLPEDATLTSAVAGLKTKSDELAAALGEHQKLVDTAADALAQATAATAAATTALESVRTAHAERQQAVTAAQTALESARSQAHADRTAVSAALDSLLSCWSADSVLADLSPLSPEQMCWSIFRVTGVYERSWQAQAAELEQAAPLSDEDRQDPAKVAARTLEIEQKTYDQLKGNVATFASLYGAGAGQPQGDFFATADQALFAANGGSVVGWVAPAGGNVTERVINETDPHKAAEELYLGALSRLPTDAEVADTTEYLARRPEQRPAAVQELVWGLITSVEFRFKH